MPILYFLAAVYCLIAYWVDKILLLKFYKKQNYYIENEIN